MKPHENIRPQILKKILLAVIASILVLSGILFLTAGTTKFWHAWAFMGTLFLPMMLVAVYFFIKDPEFLERRLRFREKESSQKKIIRAGQLMFYLALLIPGFDFRFGWSHVPFWLVITADAVIFLSYLLIFFVFRENSYASRIVEVEEGQELIRTGPYSIVRHPMYAGVIPMYLCIPLALGSWFALVPMIPVIGVIILRIFDEEDVLQRDLSGYKEYMEDVKYRLIPFIW